MKHWLVVACALLLSGCATQRGIQSNLKESIRLAELCNKIHFDSNDYATHLRNSLQSLVVGSCEFSPMPEAGLDKIPGVPTPACTASFELTRTRVGELGTSLDILLKQLKQTLQEDRSTLRRFRNRVSGLCSVRTECATEVASLLRDNSVSVAILDLGKKLHEKTREHQAAASKQVQAAKDALDTMDKTCNPQSETNAPLNNAAFKELIESTRSTVASAESQIKRTTTLVDTLSSQKFTANAASAHTGKALARRILSGLESATAPIEKSLEKLDESWYGAISLVNLAGEQPLSDALVNLFQSSFKADAGRDAQEISARARLSLARAACDRYLEAVPSAPGLGGYVRPILVKALISQIEGAQVNKQSYEDYAATYPQHLEPPDASCDAETSKEVVAKKRQELSEKFCAGLQARDSQAECAVNDIGITLDIAEKFEQRKWKGGKAMTERLTRIADYVARNRFRVSATIKGHESSGDAKDLFLKVEGALHPETCAAAGEVPVRISTGATEWETDLHPHMRPSLETVNGVRKLRISDRPSKDKTALPLYIEEKTGAPWSCEAGVLKIPMEDQFLFSYLRAWWASQLLSKRSGDFVYIHDLIEIGTAHAANDLLNFDDGSPDRFIRIDLTFRDR